jgi:nucleoside-diphosphate-sugar epimerase
MKILITGMSSALGKAIAGSFTGHEVTGLDRKKHGHYPTILCDLREGVPALPRFDICLHLAFVTDPKICRQSPAEAHTVNVLATKSLLACARRFVFISTGYVYGFRDEVLHEDLRPEPSDDYAAMKLQAEEVVHGHENSVVLRYFFPYGPATKPNSLVNRLIRTITLGQKVNHHAQGKPRTNPIYIDDLAEATRRFCLGAWRGLYNVAGLEVVSIAELAEMIGAALGKRPAFHPSGQLVRDMVGGTVKSLEVFRPAFDLRTGLDITARHFRAMENAQRQDQAA